MKIITTIREAHALVAEGSARRVLVPTMGALHQGHVELMRAARQAAGTAGSVAVSIFVNPLQFEPGSDFERYPRSEADDAEICRAAGVDLLFRPDAGEMYLADRSVSVDETALSAALCGASRPGHFRGVCTVVAKLFHALMPHAAIFGEKDFQQLAIIRRMVRDLNFSTQIIAVPTVRESDGLAMSSRNRYLNAVERADATVLRQACLAACDLVAAGETKAANVLATVRKIVSTALHSKIDYVEVVDTHSLQPIEEIRPEATLALAVFIGQTRLIDNIRLA